MRRFVFPLCVWSALAAVQATAQGPGPAAVRTTTAREHMVRGSVRLTGTVEAPRSAVVATEVAGIVEAVLAREGDAVRRGAPLVRLRSETLELRLKAARGQLAEAEARLASAKLRLVRMAELRSSEVVPAQQVDDAAYEAEAWEGRCAELEADARRLEHDLENATVKAPFGGVVAGERIEVGEWLAVGAAVSELVAPDLLEVRLEVPERYFPELTPGVRLEVRFAALPDTTVAGTLRAVVPRADPQARTFPALVRLESRDHALGAGMLAEVALPAGEPRRAVLVPKDAVVSAGASRTLYVVRDGKAQLVPVELGAGVGPWIEVRGEVAPGDAVVTRGNERLRPGAEVLGEPLEYPDP